MHEVDIFDFYRRCLVPLTPNPSVTKLLEALMAGGETTEDFAGILALDSELQHWVRLTVQRLGFAKRAAKLNQTITLLGQNHIRDLIIGRSIERSFIPRESTLLYEAQTAQKTENEAKAKTAKPGAPAKEAPAAAPAPKHAPKEAAKEEDEAAEAIPVLSDFGKYLSYAARAEELALTIRNSYPGQAFSGGVIFDYVNAYVGSKHVADKVTDPRLKNVVQYMDEIFKDGARCGIAANEIVQKIAIPHQKNVFVTALVHNIGKALMLAYDPVSFEAAFAVSTASKNAKNRVESDVAETLLYGIDHAQVGALYVGRLPFLAEIESSIDFHHHTKLLKYSNPKLYALASVLRVSGALAKIYQRARANNPNTEELRDQNLVKSPDFAFLKLSPSEWNEIKSNYALKLLKVGL